jgi:acetyl esterase
VHYRILVALASPHDLAFGLRRSFDRGVHALARVTYASLRAADPDEHGIALTRDVPYRPTGRRAHLLDVYRPRTGKPSPAVLYVHGGGFSMLSKDTHRVMALSLAHRGYTVFNINYRLGPRHTYPAPLEDACMAMQWVLDHAESWGADPSRLVLAGESAGGNLVTTLAYLATHPRPEPFARAVYERSPRVRAVLAIYGFLDLHELHRFDRLHLSPWVRAEVIAAATAYVGHPCQLRVHQAPLASPLRLLLAPPEAGARPLPPFFAAVGTADPLLDDSRRLKRAIEARGGVCELSVHPGELHGFDAMVWRPAARAKWSRAHAFLARHVAG